MGMGTSAGVNIQSSHRLSMDAWQADMIACVCGGWMRLRAGTWHADTLAWRCGRWRMWVAFDVDAVWMHCMVVNSNSLCCHFYA